MNREQKEVFDSIKEISYFKPLVEYINKIETTNLYKEYNNLQKQHEQDIIYREEHIYLLQENANLQEENKKLKHNLEQMYNDTKDTYNEICAEQIDYKSRIDKAIEYINKHTTSFKDIFIPASESWYLLELLNGGDEE